MNGQFQVAQASGTGVSNSGAPPRVFKLTKPLTDQAVIINLGYDQKVQVDFSAIATYSANPYPSAAAFSPDGNYLAGGMDGVYDDDVAMFHHTDGSTVYSLDYTDSQTAGPVTPRHGLAFSADSTQLFALADRWPEPDEEKDL